MDLYRVNRRRLAVREYEDRPDFLIEYADLIDTSSLM